RKGDVHARLDSKRNDEIGMLAREFDALLARVEEDIARREETTAALRESEKRLSTLLDAAPNAVFMLDAKGRVESANPVSMELFGYPQEAILGRPLCKIVSDPAFSNEVVFNRIAEGVDAFRGEVEAIRADGTP